MKSPLRILAAVLLVTGATCWFLAHHTHAQVSAPAMTGPSAAAPMDAEKDAIWNSPDMLRARAWLTEYCNTSAKCKPGDAEKFSNELQNMSATQMKLWLMKFDEEEQEKQQQTAFWKHVQGMAVSHAKSVNAATDKSLAAVETEETAAANQEQGRLNYEQQLEDTEGADKQLEAGDAYNPAQGYYPGDGIHFHFHGGY
jgi:hypothetical protein